MIVLPVIIAGGYKEMSNINPCTIYNLNMFDDEMVEHIDDCDICKDYFNEFEE